MKTYVDPQGKNHYRVPRTIIRLDGGCSSLPLNISDEDWERIPGCSILIVEDTVAKTEEEINLQQAVDLVSQNPDLPEIVRSALTPLQTAIVTHGLPLDFSAGVPGWSEVGLAFSTAIKNAVDLDAVKALSALQYESDGYWRTYQHWAGDSKTAYKLAPYIVSM
jgi:hypothetical protein